MTCEPIDALQSQANGKYEVAKRIRQMLDAAADPYGAAQWDENSVESEILDLVTTDQ